MRILALNGGGTAGFASCLVLEKLEADTNLRCADIFDLIAGVSTGAIITGGLGIGLSAATMVEMYEKEIPKIFAKPKWPFWRGYVGPAKYSAQALEDMLASVFKDISISETKTDCMINATQISPKLQPYFWKSWRSESIGYRLKDVIRASSAAPTFFTPKSIGMRTFIDGGMSANNPSHCAVAEALRLGAKLEEVSLLNLQLGDGASMSQAAAEDLHSMLDWAPKLLDTMLGSNVEISEYIAKYLVTDYISVDFNFPEPLDYWSTAFAADARRRVDAYWAAYGPRIVESVLFGKKTMPISRAETVTVPVLQNDTKNEGSNGSNAVDPRADH